MHSFRSSMCCFSMTDHMFAMCRGASSAFLCAAQSGLHLFHFLRQHLLFLGQLLVTVEEDTETECQQTTGHYQTVCLCSVFAYKCVRVHLTPEPGCGAPRSPLPAFGCCPPCPPPPASASSPPPGVFGCSSGGRQHSKPALTFHWGRKYTNG